MPNFRTQRQVRHSAQKMFALVADIERYPEFLPMCETLTIRSRREQDGNILLVADMSVGYKLVRESFVTQVYLRPQERRIDVKYIDGPFKYLENRWQFFAPAAPNAQSGQSAALQRDIAAKAAGAPLPAEENAAGADGDAAPLAAGKSDISAAAESCAESCIVDFYIDYAFKNPLLSVLMGAMFDIAFRKFTQAFETRADKIYGIQV